jgi:hypothetical protein
VRWDIRKSVALKVLEGYRGFDNVRSFLVTQELNTAVNKVFATYDPLAVDNNGSFTAPPLNLLAGQVATMLRQEDGASINVMSVFIPMLHFNVAVQHQINKIEPQGIGWTGVLAGTKGPFWHHRPVAQKRQRWPGGHRCSCLSKLSDGGWRQREADTEPETVWGRAALPASSLATGTRKGEQDT